MKTALTTIVVIMMMAIPAFAAENMTMSPTTETKPTGRPADESSTAGALKKVEAQYICMMNNRAFDKPQIPVEVEGRTYYGCCPMCAQKLKTDASVRMGTDPVSSKNVDKAMAVIGVAADGSVYYFENEENMTKFKAEPQEGAQ